ncbi:MAG: protease [Bacteroidetes bacterium RIFCSPHIGHO2_02_FULL_44_7]|nr:MAG: protease [Bacteroidetes bacterium RIFCSPHIGHO2_02_FULL_44_7]
MTYTGLHTQIQRNNRRSLLLLLSFPLLILVGIYAFLFFVEEGDFETINYDFIQTIPIVIAVVLVWFLIAYASNSALIRMSTGAATLERKENMRVYNLTENLCMSVGMKMPNLYVINSPALNAFASGINEKSYAVTLTTGIIETLDDRELEGVIAHELTHIRNRDVRLLIISIIFVGIFGFVVQVLFRSMLYGSGRRKDSKVDGRVMLIALVVAAIVYLLSILFKFALSRKREYLADAGAVEMTKNPQAMANALRKISGNHDLEVKSSDVKQMFIANYAKANANSGISGMFATHPPIEKRIAFLEQM